MAPCALNHDKKLRPSGSNSASMQFECHNINLGTGIALSNVTGYMLDDQKQGFPLKQVKFSGKGSIHLAQYMDLS
jgi:hypothetical protein